MEDNTNIDEDGRRWIDEDNYIDKNGRKVYVHRHWSQKAIKAQFKKERQELRKRKKEGSKSAEYLYDLYELNSNDSWHTSTPKSSKTVRSPNDSSHASTSDKTERLKSTVESQSNTNSVHSVQKRRAKPIISKSVQKKIKAFVSKISKIKEEKATRLKKKSVKDYCSGNKLLTIPLIHENKSVRYSFYSFFGPENDPVENYNKLAFRKGYCKKTVKLTEPYDFYRNSFNRDFVHSEYTLDVQWFNEMNEYIANLSNMNLIMLNTYTDQYNTYIVSYIRNNFKPAQDLFEKFLKRLAKSILSLKTHVFSPLFIPFVIMIDEMSRDMDPAEIVIKLFNKPKDQLEFTNFIKKYEFELKNSLGVSQFFLNFVKMKGFNYKRYYHFLVAFTFLKQECVINIHDIYIDSIEKIISNAPKTRKVMQLYNGVKPYEEDVNHYKKGLDPYEDGNLFSQKKGVFFKNDLMADTSYNYNSAGERPENHYERNKKINEMYGEWSWCCMNIITVLPGSSVLWVGGITYGKKFLLSTNTTFMVRETKHEIVQSDEYGQPSTNGAKQDICNDATPREMSGDNTPRIKVTHVVAL